MPQSCVEQLSNRCRIVATQRSRTPTSDREPRGERGPIVATWNAQALGITNLRVVAEEAEDLVKKRIGILCI